MVKNGGEWVKGAQVRPYDQGENSGKGCGCKIYEHGEDAKDRSKPRSEGVFR